MFVALWPLDCQNATNHFAPILKMMHFQTCRTTVSFFLEWFKFLHTEYLINKIRLKILTQVISALACQTNNERIHSKGILRWKNNQTPRYELGRCWTIARLKIQQIDEAQLLSAIRNDEIEILVAWFGTVHLSRNWFPFQNMMIIHLNWMRVANQFLPNRPDAESHPFHGDLVQANAPELIVGYVREPIHHRLRISIWPRGRTRWRASEGKPMWPRRDSL